MKFIFIAFIFILSCGGSDYLEETQEARGIFTEKCSRDDVDCDRYAKVMCDSVENCEMSQYDRDIYVSHEQCLFIINKYHHLPTIECIECYESMKPCDLLHEPNVCTCPMCYPAETCRDGE